MENSLKSIRRRFISSDTQFITHGQCEDIQKATLNNGLDELLKYEPSGLADKDAWYVVGFKDCLEQFKSKIEGMKL